MTARLPLLFLACLGAGPLAAATPTELYVRLSGNVLLLEGRDTFGAPLVQGSAVALGDAEAVTQCDLLAGAPSWQVIQGSSEYMAAVRERDEARNLCRLEVPDLRANRLEIVPIDQVNIGQRAYAIGNALGLGLSMTDGLVSGIRELGGESWIQTTAPLAPGSEGGALFAADGRLLGITDYRKRDGQNINFAAPAAWLPEIARRVQSGDNTAARRGEAVRLFRASDWKALAELAADWSRQQPERGDAWFWLGAAREQLKDIQGAADALEKALDRMPGSVTLALALARNQLLLKQPDQALKVLRHAIELNREEASLWYAQGLAEEMKGNRDAALQAFAETLRLDPRHLSTWAKKHDDAIASGDRYASWQAASHLTEIAPEQVDYWRFLAMAHLRLKHPARALAAVGRAAELAPDNGDVMILRGIALFRLHANAAAIAELKRGVAAKPAWPAEGWYQLGKVYGEVSMHPEAIAALREAVRLEPEDLGYKAELAVALKDGGEDAAALEIVQALRDKTPKEAFPWRQIGFIQSKLGHYDEAIKALEESLRLAPDQDKVWHALGETYAHAGRMDDVRRVYQRLRGLNAKRAEQFYREFLLYAEVQP